MAKPWKKSHALPSADAVLAGHVVPDAVATFIDVHRVPAQLEVLLPAPWSAERLADLARQAEHWLRHANLDPT